MTSQPGRVVRLEGRTITLLQSALGPPRHRGASWLAELFDEERTISVSSIDRPALMRDLVSLNLARTDGDTVVPLARLDLVGKLLVASDLRARCLTPDFVGGPARGSFLLARHVRLPVRGLILDLGCGSGIQGLLLGAGRAAVLGIDINPRAVAFARSNAGLNGHRRMHADLGDFLGADPDTRLDGRFRTVVANPPFVLAPRAELVYRDRPLPGDQVSVRTIERVGRAIGPGGRGYVLCNWIDRGGDWSDPVRSWIAATGLDGVAMRVASLTASEYAAVWTRDLPETDRDAAASSWVAALDREGIGCIHVGVVALSRRPRRRFPSPTFSATEQPPASSAWRALEALLSG